MGRKRVDEPKVNVNLRICKELNERLKQAGVNRSRLFEKAAEEYLKKFK